MLAHVTCPRPRDLLHFTSPFRSPSTTRSTQSQRRSERSPAEREGGDPDPECLEELYDEGTVLEEAVSDQMKTANDRRKGSSAGRGWGESTVDVSAMHETVLTRVNETLLAFKSGEETRL
eukprot:TRINITY_DN6734_c0_g1_i1.p4 TRINITY_DN6734_c0_g1~~TRINITY_DN6734_c0_g1_i1.p4  ORF type:complete len:120 (-),score=19.37 TRINITY_DN6734_c0_g1_i1:936-1295(-)